MSLQRSAVCLMNDSRLVRTTGWTCLPEGEHGRCMHCCLIMTVGLCAGVMLAYVPHTVIALHCMHACTYMRTCKQVTLCFYGLVCEELCVGECLRMCVCVLRGCGVWWGVQRAVSSHSRDHLHSSGGQSLGLRCRLWLRC